MIASIEADVVAAALLIVDSTKAVSCGTVGEIGDASVHFLLLEDAGVRPHVDRISTYFTGIGIMCGVCVLSVAFHMDDAMTFWASGKNKAVAGCIIVRVAPRPEPLLRGDRRCRWHRRETGAWNPSGPAADQSASPDTLGTCRRNKITLVLVWLGKIEHECVASRGVLFAAMYGQGN